jgi:hypothetical protein
VAYKNAGLCAQRRETEKRGEYFQALKLNPNQPQALYLAEITIAGRRRNSTPAVTSRLSRIQGRGTVASRASSESATRTALANYGMQLRRRYPSAPETKAFVKPLRMTDAAARPHPEAAAPVAYAPAARAQCWRTAQPRLSLGDIARQLKLSVRQSSPGAGDGVSGPVFVRGFTAQLRQASAPDEPLLAAASVGHTERQPCRA